MSHYWKARKGGECRRRKEDNSEPFKSASKVNVNVRNSWASTKVFRVFPFAHLWGLRAPRDILPWWQWQLQGIKNAGRRLNLEMNKKEKSLLKKLSCLLQIVAKLIWKGDKTGWGEKNKMSLFLWQNPDAESMGFLQSCTSIRFRGEPIQNRTLPCCT